MNNAGAQGPTPYPTHNLPGSAQYELPPPLREGYQPPPRDLGPMQGAYPTYTSQGPPQQGYPLSPREGYQPPYPMDLGPLAAAFAQPPQPPPTRPPYPGMNQAMGPPVAAYAPPPPMGFP